MKSSCFNEAAAYRCGIQRLGIEQIITEEASMRPQHIAAEYESLRR